LLHSWKGRYEHFARPYFAPYKKTKMSKGVDPKALEELSFKSCPLGHEYDQHLQNAIHVAQLRILDGSLPVHPKHGSAVNFFAPAGAQKY